MQVYQQALDQAVAHHRSGDLSKAEFLYNRVFNRDPMNAGLQMALANLYMQREFNARYATWAWRCEKRVLQITQKWCGTRR
jgi:Flp pilus assembly protein TadD